MIARPISLALALALVICGCGKKEPSAGAGKAAGGAVSAARAPDALQVDKVSNGDGPIKTDGEKDAAVALTIDGPVAALTVISVDASGKPEGGQQWDTYVGDQPVPQAIGTGFEDGGGTWQLGVFEGKQPRNAANGSLSALGAGRHQLTLYLGDSGVFDSAHLVVIAERPDHTLVRSNVFKF